MRENDTVYGISARVVRRGLARIPQVSITDGVDTWTFDVAESFTVKELEQRLPYFKKLDLEELKRVTK